MDIIKTALILEYSLLCAFIEFYYIQRSLEEVLPRRPHGPKIENAHIQPEEIPRNIGAGTANAHAERNGAE